MRRFIRHPSDIPIEHSFAQVGRYEKDQLRNISEGGLCFRSNAYIEPGRAIRINIAITKPAFEIVGVVVWCHKDEDSYDLGVKFQDAEAQHSVRMVEQVCHIERYRMEVLRKEGRALSGEQAAVEWIEKYAAEFPR